MMLILCRPRFPGATESPITTEMAFLRPSSLPIIPTYRVMNNEGVLDNPNRSPPDVTDQQVLTWYNNMLTGVLDRSSYLSIQCH